MSRSAAALIAFLALAATATGAAARDTTATVVHRGQPVKLGTTSLPVTSIAVCSAVIRYADGAVQQVGGKHAYRGRVSWIVRIPNNAMLGLAHWTIHCGVVWQRNGTWRVAKPVTPPPAVPSVIVTNNGFSQRPDKFGTGSKVSYGLFLKNLSSKQDAQNVYLLVNFVAADGELLGSASQTVPLITAGQTYAYGAEMTLRTQSAVAKLEVTIKVPTGEPAVAQPLPHFANVRVIPDPHDPGWVSEVDGEIVNDTSTQTLTNAKLSIVLVDGSGNIVGGGNTTVISPLPSGSRMVFLAQQGFTSVPTQKAVTPVISVLPTYQTS